ncbi:hypothetical protein D083_2392 [Dickeya solani RNS 08.23.3.1.A]|nr:hypothetical protein D083_2392 [Dickeya solani RNS 08.23.3.1.A]
MLAKAAQPILRIKNGPGFNRGRFCFTTDVTYHRRQLT